MDDSTKQDDRFSVSVAIPAYNLGELIERSIESVLTQSRPADEIIVVDDGSTDDTAEHIKKFGDKITYIYQSNAGVSAARNTAIQAAKSDWIAFLDGDDEWKKDKLRLQIELLQRNKDLAWATGNYLRCLCDEKRQSIDISTNKASELLHGLDYFDNFFTAFRADAYGCTDTMIVKREVLEKIGGFPVGQKNAEDMDLWWRIAYHIPKIGYVNQPLAVYHLGTPQSLSQTHQFWDQYIEMIERHLKIAAELGKLADFQPCAVYVLRRWLRAMLFDGRSDDIRKMLRRFAGLMPLWYKVLMRILTAFPRATALGCHTISRIVRLLGLRRQLVRKPK